MRTVKETECCIFEYAKYKKIGYKISSDISRKTCILYNNQMHDIRLGESADKCILSVYNLEGEIYYISYTDKLKKCYEDGEYRVFDGDVLIMDNGMTIDFIIK